MAESKDVVFPAKGKYPKKLDNRNFSMYPKDIEILNWIAAYLGCSQSEAARTAIRSFGAQLQTLARSSPD